MSNRVARALLLLCWCFAGSNAFATPVEIATARDASGLGDPEHLEDLSAREALADAAQNADAALEGLRERPEPRRAEATPARTRTSLARAPENETRGVRAFLAKTWLRFRSGPASGIQTSLSAAMRVPISPRARPGHPPEPPRNGRRRGTAGKSRDLEASGDDVGATSVIRIARSLDEVAAFREAWQRLQWHPFGDFDYYLNVVARKNGFLRPHVLAIERGGRTVGLVTASLVEESIPWRVGSVKVATSRARVLRIGGVGIMGACDIAAARAVLQTLMQSLAESEADVLYLHQLDTRSPLLQVAREMPDGFARDRFVRIVPGWSLTVPETYDEFLRTRSKAVRKNLRRYANLMGRELGEIQVACYSETGELDRILRESTAVARRTYHERLGHAFADTPATREYVRYALQAGWFRAYFLYQRGQPIAFGHALHYGTTLFARDTGFDPAYGVYRPGTYLLVRMIEEHCGNGTQRIDYGVMDADYKRMFGTHREEFASAYVFARSAKGLSMGIKRAVTGSLDRIARSMLGSSRARRLSRLVGLPGRS